MLLLLEKRDELVSLNYKSVGTIKKEVATAWKTAIASRGLVDVPFDKVQGYVWTYFIVPKSKESNNLPSKPSSSQSTTMVKSCSSRKTNTQKKTHVFDSKIKNIQDYPLKPLPLFPAIESVDMHQELAEYRGNAYDQVKSQSFTTQQLLSSSNIILLTQSEPLEFLSAEKSNQLYASITTPLFENIPTIPPVVLSDFDASFSSFNTDNDTLLLFL
ncbi:hypothetical protein BD560DRAFT_64931 [Blakeslea trispora]|nr:hypothetical protein BD560DRAFT_64931 [Blakeslea trispora]